MLLDEDPAALIRGTYNNFNIAPDKAAITRIQECLSSVSQIRQLSLSTTKSHAARSQRTLQTLSSSHAETLAAHDPSLHASHISELDSQKFRVAKQAQDLEERNERLRAELEEVERALIDIEVEGVEGGEGARRTEVEDEVVLKLRLYRELGLERDGSAKGEGDKVVVRRGKEAVHVVPVDGKMSKYFYAGYFWGLIGEGNGK